MRRVRRLTRNEEHGQVLVMSVMFMAVLLGAAALTLDLGRMAVTRRYLQNTADSSALAGAWSLPVSEGAGIEAAMEWATDNDKYALAASEVTGIQVKQANSPHDTIRVDVMRTVPWIFGRALGLNSANITATATAQLRLLRGITAGETRAFPYAIWDGNINTKIKIGDTVVFRSNNYDGVNVEPAANCKKNPDPTVCTWDIVGSDFKGYFHWNNGYNIYVQTGYAFSQGGNGIGTSDFPKLMEYYQAGIPILLPVIDRARNPNSNTLDFNISSFVCVRVTQISEDPSVDWKALILPGGCAADGLYEGPRQPSIKNAFVVVLIQ